MFYVNRKNLQVNVNLPQGLSYVSDNVIEGMTKIDKSQNIQMKAVDCTNLAVYLHTITVRYVEFTTNANRKYVFKLHTYGIINIPFVLFFSYI
jgi:hypothetical protein